MKNILLMNISFLYLVLFLSNPSSNNAQSSSNNTARLNYHCTDENLPFCLIFTRGVEINHEQICLSQFPSTNTAIAMQDADKTDTNEHSYSSTIVTDSMKVLPAGHGVLCLRYTNKNKKDELEITTLEVYDTKLNKVLKTWDVLDRGYTRGSDHNTHTKALLWSINSYSYYETYHYILRYTVSKRKYTYSFYLNKQRYVDNNNTTWTYFTDSWSFETKEPRITSYAPRNTNR